MQITFLGTGTSQGVPLIACNCDVCKSQHSKDKRLRSSILIHCNNKNIVVDTGPDFRQQMLRENVQTLDAILYTHAHKDHTAGLDDVRAFNFIQQKSMPIYAETIVQESLRQEFAYIFQNPNYPGIPLIHFHTINENPFIIDGIEIIPIRAIHYRLPVLGFRVKNFVYITDANYIDEKEIEKLKNVDVLVLNALRHEKHISHFTLAEAIELANAIKPRATYFTHISHQLGLHAEQEQLLPDNFFLAYDGLTLSI